MPYTVQFSALGVSVLDRETNAGATNSDLKKTEVLRWRDIPHKYTGNDEQQGI